MKSVINSTTSVARAISGKKNVSVIIKGTQAYTNGKNIVIPDLGTKITEKQANLLRGYLDHEVGHVSHTNFKVLKTIKNRKLKSLHNLLEDIREEALVGEEYPGSKKNLTALNNHIIESFDFSSPLSALFVEGYRQVSGQDLQAPDLSEKVKEAYGSDIIDRMKSLENTKDTLDLARELLKDLEEKAKEEAVDEGTGEGDSREEQTSDDSPASSEGAKCAEGAESSEGTEGSEVAEDSEGKGVKNSATDDKKESSGGCDVLAGDVLEALEEMKDKNSMIGELLEGLAEKAKKDGYVVFNTDEDQLIRVREAEDSYVYDNLKKELGNMNVARMKFTQLFKTMTASRWQGDKEQGRINNRALASVASGSRRVFKQKQVGKDIDTAVTFLCDFSGSMGGYHSRLGSAMKATIMFLETLNGLGIKSEVLGYTTAGKTKAYQKAYYTSPGNISHKDYGRVEKLVTYEFKTFAEPFSASIKRRISSFQDLHLRENCDPCSVKLAYERLMQRKEKRKILIVLTDGMVQNGANCITGDKELTRLVGEIERQSAVEVIGVGLESSWVRYNYPKHIVTTRKGLVADLLKGLKEVLIK